MHATAIFPLTLIDVLTLLGCWLAGVLVLLVARATRRRGR